MTARKTINKLIKPFGVKLVRRNPCQMKYPTIFIVTLPKSGSTYLFRTLSRTLNARAVRPSLTYYPGDLLNINGLKDMMRGGYVLQSHIDPSRINIRILNAYVDRLVIHVRDPRQHLYSLIHYIDRLHSEKPEALLTTEPLPPPVYFSWTLNEKIDWHLSHYLPIAIDWISDWLAAAKGGFSGHVLFTDYRDFLSDNTQFIQRILEFYGIDSVAVVSAQKDKSTNFRRADPEEWRTAFSPAQIERATSTIPEDLRQKFHWPA